ncbi:MAG: zinc-dependent peptidase [Steroidobacteraceae bacterium]|nr:zinc-dependent peptidase [Steroidobacteraceae bacterium]
MTALLIAFGFGLAIIAWLVAGPWWRRRARARLAADPLPPDWRRELERWPLYARVPAEFRPRLDGLVKIFLAEKEFVGCGGLEITDPIRLAIAVQACLLVLNRDEHVFDELHSILVYPDEFVVPETWDEDGVVTEGERVLAGQAWDTSRIILSWRDVAESGDGYNVVIHEFAHYLDEESGGINGAPRLATDADHERWAAVMQQAFDELQARAEAGEETLLDPYGAEDEAEFFAVATETFFELPRELRDEHPELYAELKACYRLDPAEW